MDTSETGLEKIIVDWRDDEFHEIYMLSYTLDTETSDSLLNLKRDLAYFRQFYMIMPDIMILQTRLQNLR